jgi:hypothetical protein
MLAIFEMMGKDMGNECSDLNPWNFFREENTVCLWRIVIAALYTDSNLASDHDPP